MERLQAFMDWFQNSPWGFICFILAVVGVLMAAPSFLTLMFGRPKLETEFVISDTRPEYFLMFRMFNRPVAKWKSCFGIRRLQIDDLRANASIRESGSNQVVIHSTPVVIRRWAASDGLITFLPASRHGAEVVLVHIDSATGTATECISGSRQVLSAGDYVAVLDVEADGERHFENLRTFRIQTSRPFGHWIN